MPVEASLPLVVQLALKDANFDVLQAQPGPPVAPAAEPIPVNIEEEKTEHPFAEIGRFYIEFMRMHGELQRALNPSEKLKQIEPIYEVSPVETPVALEQKAHDETDPVATESSTEPAEAAIEPVEMLRVFVSPAGSVFRVREADWIGASTSGSKNVPLCDLHGQYIESDPSQARTKTTMRMSYAHSYEQTLTEVLPVPKIEPKRRGRRR